MKTVTVQQIKDYVLAQPDDKPVDNYQGRSCEKFGCVMVQYGKEILNLKDFGCGHYNWEYLKNSEHTLCYDNNPKSISIDPVGFTSMVLLPKIDSKRPDFI